MGPNLSTYIPMISGVAALNFEERFTVIQHAAPEAVGDFAAEASLGRDELFALRRRRLSCPSSSLVSLLCARLRGLALTQR